MTVMFDFWFGEYCTAHCFLCQVNFWEVDGWMSGRGNQGGYRDLGHERELIADYLARPLAATKK